MVQTWGNVLTASFQEVWQGIINFLPSLIVAAVILVVGWAVGVIIGKIVTQVIKSLKLDHALRGVGVEDALRKGGINLNSGAFVGGLVRWFVILVFLIASFDVLGLTKVNDFLNEVLNYIPQVIIAVLIVLVGAVIADVMKKIVVGAAAAADFRHSSLLGLITKWAIWIFAILTALYQLGIASTIISTLFTGVVVAMSLAIGLSFGLGGQEAAREIVEKVKGEMRGKM